MPADEVLPRFQIRPSADGNPYHQTILFSHDYRPAEPAYLKSRSKHPDEYSIALLDAYIPDIIFAQVVAKPTISTPSLSLDEIRRQNNGGSPNLPTITLPTSFTIQLYNPESQVIVHHKSSKWTGSYWEFTLPRRSFRQPTGSRLDAELARNNALPPTDVSTFRWRKDGGVVSKTSLRCTMLSPASNSGDKNAKKKGGSEPDITVAIMDKLKDVTIYQPSLQRVDVEDKKGLEVALLLTATVIADIYFTPPSTSFNVGIQTAVSPNNGPNVRPQRPLPTTVPTPVGFSADTGRRRSSSISPITGTPPTYTLIKTPTPPNNAPTVVNNNVLRDTATLQRQQAIEDRRRLEEEKKRQREAALEEKRIRKMLEKEEADRRKEEARVNAETERLKKQYGSDAAAWDRLRRDQDNSQNYGYYGHQRNQSVPQPPSSYNQRPPVIVEPTSTSPNQPAPNGRRWSQQLPPRQPLYPVPESQQARPPQNGQHLSPDGPPSSFQQPQKQPKKKSSGFLGIFGGGNSSGNGLAKKKSSFF
ncbi:hypothetical protein TWF569_002914 [Orbilia oligospora]|uniref:Uncharacterized protein n=1 Tax=Orbilia oligospora TaxID=2813651 RepID=A0A7C8NPJ1_ORBOL|nr:hypothetical protein TWF706_007456 [Orbilia oligospora]KAF3111492.1 hypothetical protein TWF102_007155 [Orbilia oligospora]KAF3117319.1 hypothetical protein TWF103_007460 [Orbilia oligospora]KAF3128220.1 hypothetical protein TWF703_009663 [Orbilia oligospora]KAF3140744.1 hypothetical protein TWF594_006245 [Orbilia oligospora]